MDENNELTEQLTEEQAPRKRFKKRYVIIPAVILLVILVGGWWLIGEMLGYTTYSRMQTKCSRAHVFAKVCTQWEEEGNELTSGIWKVEPGHSDFEDYVLQYDSDAEGEWYALVLDKDGGIEYTLNSESEIPKEYLTHAPDYEEQMALLDSHFAFRRKKAIGAWYTDDSKNTLND